MREHSDLTDAPAEQWPLKQPPVRIVAADALEQLRNNLRSRVDYVVDVFGFKASMIATTAKMSEKGLQGYADPGWNPTPQTMIQLDETIEHHLATWMEAARAARSNGQ
jgi:hypothetical protein